MFHYSCNEFTEVQSVVLQNSDLVLLNFLSLSLSLSPSLSLSLFMCVHLHGDDTSVIWCKSNDRPILLAFPKSKDVLRAYFNPILMS